MNTVEFKNENGMLKINNKIYFINTMKLNNFDDGQLITLVDELKHIEKIYELYQYGYDKLVLTYFHGEINKTLIISKDMQYIMKTNEFIDLSDINYLDLLIDFTNEGIEI